MQLPRIAMGTLASPQYGLFPSFLLPRLCLRHVLWRASSAGLFSPFFLAGFGVLQRLLRSLTQHKDKHPSGIRRFCTSSTHSQRAKNDASRMEKGRERPQKRSTLQRYLNRDGPHNVHMLEPLDSMRLLFGIEFSGFGIAFNGHITFFHYICAITVLRH